MGHARNHTGRRLGKLTVIRRAYETGHRGSQLWVVRCDCGIEKLLGTNAFSSNRSCGCESPRHPSYIRKEITGTVYADLRLRHRERTGSEFGLIDMDTFRTLIMMGCTYCGAPPSNERKGMFYQGIDRVDNTLGYVEGNCVPCCGKCNYFKHKMTEDEFLMHVYKIAKYRGWTND